MRQHHPPRRAVAKRHEPRDASWLHGSASRRYVRWVRVVWELRMGVKVRLGWGAHDEMQGSCGLGRAWVGYNRYGHGYTSSHVTVR